LTNEDFDIIHMSTHAGRYLRFAGGEPSRNLLKLIHPDLRADLHATLLEAKSREPGIAIHSRRLSIELQGNRSCVVVTVRQAGTRPAAARGFYLAIFDEAAAVAPIASAASLEEKADHGGNLDAAARLEEELQHTRERLR